MQELLGNIFTALIIDENDKAYYVQKNGQTFRLLKEKHVYQLGDSVEGFGYQNQKQDYCFTTTLPNVYQGHYGFGQVVASRKDLGVFIDIGLSDKEVVLSLDELPSERSLWPKKGDRLLITLTVDEKNRLWAKLAEDQIFQAMARHTTDTDLKNKDISGVVYRAKLVGSYVLTDDYHLGFIHPSERFMEPRLGEQISGRVIGIRPDGIINISLKPRAHEVIDDDAQMLLTFLHQSPTGSIPFTDKSSPAEIQATFAISKGQFKRALGSLLKQRKVVQKDGRTLLLETKKE